MSAAETQTEAPTLDTSEAATLRRLFDNLFGDVNALLADLPAEALLWVPFEHSPWQGESNSVGKVVAHALSSTVYLLRRAEYCMARCEWGDVQGDEGREEFGPANHDPAYLQARVQRTQDFVHSFLASVNADDLAASRTHPKRPLTFGARQDVYHAFDHLSQHIGHGQLTRQLWALQNA